MRIVIIGNGIAGITAARHIRKNSDAEIIVISGESRYFFSRTALMYVYMGHMKFEHTQPYENWFWKKNDIGLIQDWVVKLNTTEKFIAVKSGDVIEFDKLILATGSTPMKLDIPGSNLAGVQSLYSRQDLELMELNTRSAKKAVVIGGGLIGVEMAEMLHSRGIDVTMIIREDSFWNIVLPTAESNMITEHIRSRGVNVIVSTTVDSIIGTDRAETVRLSNGETLRADFVGITIGVKPNTGLIKDTTLETNRGILVDEHLQTSEPNIYAIGDCAELKNVPEGRKAVEAIWYSGRKMGETVARTVTGNTTKYEPGLWFNSAKFFDLEYQTYGYVPNQEEPGIIQHYWEDRKKDTALRIVTNSDLKVIGMNAIGLRLNQKICEEWIESGLPIAEAIKRIEDINFNAEFSDKLSKLITPVTAE